VAANYHLDSNLVEAGLKEAIDLPKVAPAQYHEPFEIVDRWLALIPFSTHPGRLLELLALVDEKNRQPSRLQRLLGALRDTTSSEADDLLFSLASSDSRFYSDAGWVGAISLRGSNEGLKKLFDKVCEGKVVATTVVSTFHVFSKKLIEAVGSDQSLRR
jgi:hypothetical protein